MLFPTVTYNGRGQFLLLVAMTNPGRSHQPQRSFLCEKNMLRRCELVPDIPAFGFVRHTQHHLLESFFACRKCKKIFSLWSHLFAAGNIHTRWCLSILYFAAEMWLKSGSYFPHAHVAGVDGTHLSWMAKVVHRERNLLFVTIVISHVLCLTSFHLFLSFFHFFPFLLSSLHFSTSSFIPFL